MLILNTIAAVRAAVSEVRARGGSVGLVPTMGALHAGHRALVRAAKAANDAVVVSIFVNPTQFGPNEDFSRYPRTFEADCALLEAEGVDFVFAPAVEEIYPEGATTFVSVTEIEDRLDGKSRPGHFRGVATVVAKLFHIVATDRAYFGQKDAAQVAVLRKMVRDLDFPLELAVCPIVREADGLALSSRNRYLSHEDRQRALVLSRALRRAEELYLAGTVSSNSLLEGARRVLASEPEVRIDYLAAVDPLTLEDLEEAGSGSLIAVAAWVGTTRLIDNVVLPPSDVLSPG
jgi:pantoate--beta-alanine ligase